MSKPALREPLATLENHAIKTMIEGLHYYRPDLSFPESYSDMEACFRGLLRMYSVELRLSPFVLEDNYYGS